MKDREPLIAGCTVALLVILWLGFLVHTSPRFAGSTWGGVIGVTGAVLMTISASYVVVKRVRFIKGWVTRHVSMRTLLTWHMYTGLIGAVLGLLHTGHKFESPLGIGLTAMMLLTVVSGYVGRFLMKEIALEVSEKKVMLTQLEVTYREIAGDLAANAEQAAFVRPWSGLWGRLVASVFPALPSAPHSVATVRAIRLSESIADLEYAIKSHETFRWWFGFWLRFHLVTSGLLFVLLFLHVWAGIHYGLRWFA